MSSTVRFTPLHPLPEDGEDVTIYPSRNSHGAGVKILDREGLEDELNDTFVDQMDTRTTMSRDEYPRREWDLLLGFTTYGRDDDEPGGGADYHNVSNTGPKKMARKWARISQYTEPFVLYQTDFEGHWPHAAELEKRDDGVFRVEAVDGEVTMEQIRVGIVDREEVDL